MARIDFTDLLSSMEATQEPAKYRRLKDNSIIPGLEVEVYVSESDSSDVYFAPRSACELLGLNRNWLNTSYDRPSTMDRLSRFGFKAEKRMVNVMLENSATRLSKPCIALDRQDFDALMEYAASVGKREAIALRNAFMLLGLVGAAGLADNPAKTREAFLNIYNQCKVELEAE